MRSKPHMQRYESYGYDPYATRVENMRRCSVCGWAGIDAEKVQEPEQAVFTQVVTGTTYVIPAGTPVEGLGIRDKDVFTQVGVGAA